MKISIDQNRNFLKLMDVLSLKGAGTLLLMDLKGINTWRFLALQESLSSLACSPFNKKRKT